MLHPSTAGREIAADVWHWLGGDAPRDPGSLTTVLPCPPRNHFPGPEGLPDEPGSACRTRRLLRLWGCSVAWAGGSARGASPGAGGLGEGETTLAPSSELSWLSRLQPRFLPPARAPLTHLALPPSPKLRLQGCPFPLISSNLHPPVTSFFPGSSHGFLCEGEGRWWGAAKPSCFGQGSGCSCCGLFCCNQH